MVAPEMTGKAYSILNDIRERASPHGPRAVPLGGPCFKEVHMNEVRRMTLHLSSDAWSALEAIAAADARQPAEELEMLLEVMAGTLPAASIGVGALPDAPIGVGALGRRLEGAFLNRGAGLPRGRCVSRSPISCTTS